MSSSLQPRFSNTPGSNASSSGRFRIGRAYQGCFGLAYRLHGLDSTNSNALRRYVVLHAHDCVPETEVYPAAICMSQGCPTVSPGLLRELVPYLDQSERPVMLEILP